MTSTVAADAPLNRFYVSLIGYVGGVDPAPPTSPPRNLTGDPYVTDGSRAVIMLSRSATEAAPYSWG